MIEQQGRVVRLSGNEAAVQVGPASGCPACAAGNGCGAGIFARLLQQRKPLLLQVQNVVGALPGQTVMLGVPERAFLHLLSRLYLLPLIAGLGGAAAGRLLADMLEITAGMADAASLVGAFISFGVVLFLLRGREAEVLRQLNPQLLRTIPDRPAGADCQK